MHILVDLDNVLLDSFDISDDGSLRFFWAENIQKDLNIDPSSLQQIFQKEFLFKPEAEMQKYVEQFLKNSNIHLSYEEFLEYWLKHDSKQNDDVFAWLKNASRKHKIHIASNQPVIRMNFLLRKFKQWNDCFDKVFIPFNLGYAKPDKDFFTNILKELNAQPCDVLLIDDDKKNVESAKILGLNTIHYRNIDDLNSCKFI